MVCGVARSAAMRVVHECDIAHDAAQDFQRLAGMSESDGSTGVTSFVQQGSVPTQAPLPYSGTAPAFGPTTAKAMGRAPGNV